MLHYTLYYVNKTGYQAHCNSLFLLFSQCKCNAIDVSEREGEGAGERGEERSMQIKVATERERTIRMMRERGERQRARFWP